MFSLAVQQARPVQAGQNDAELARLARIATLGPLSVSIAHEVNQPLAAIVLLAEAAQNWLRADPPEVVRAIDALDMMKTAAGHSNDIVHSILGLARRAPPATAGFAVDAALSAVTTLLRGQIQGAGIALRCEFGLDDFALVGHRAQFQQVIMNLLVNAIEAVEEGGPERGEIVLRSWRDAAADEVHVVVQDNGVGIDPVIAPHLFEAFTSGKTNGIGTGLSICRSIVAAHGGRIWFESEPDQGACFHVALPCAPANDVAPR